MNGYLIFIARQWRRSAMSESLDIDSWLHAKCYEEAYCRKFDGRPTVVASGAYGRSVNLTGLAYKGLGY